ncbi:hypothetical protein, partial [Bifidobacterium sp. UBA6881]|uniref:hypothetical protein n=1 Tax=Bifidobacterium sp. UBA6881 TaxID=1946109 RepID=UPI0025B94CB4
PAHRIVRNRYVACGRDAYVLQCACVGYSGENERCGRRVIIRAIAEFHSGWRCENKEITRPTILKWYKRERPESSEGPIRTKTGH